MFHFIYSYDLVETEVYHQKFSFTRKWEDCGGLSDCEVFVWLLKGDRSGVTQTDILVGQVGLEPTTGRL